MSYFPRTSAQLNAADMSAITRPAIRSISNIQADIRACMANVITNRERLIALAKELQTAYHTEKRNCSLRTALAEAAGKSPWWARSILEGVADEITPADLPPIPESNITPEKDKAVPALTNSPTSISKTTKAAPPVSAPIASVSAPITDTTPEPPKDKTGMTIPQALVPLFARRDEVTKLEHAASLLSAHFERLQKDTDPLWASVKQSGNVQTFLRGASSMRYQLAECCPDVVCPECQGKAGKCHECCGSGCISEVRWRRDWVKSNDKKRLAEVKRRTA